MDQFDVEEEGVLTAIFKESFPESWKNDTNFVHYLSELSSYGVEKLAQEPDRLCEEKTQILEDTQNLAFQNYKTFIQTAECSREIFEDFQIIEEHVESLLEKLPVFSEHCNQVLKKALDISSSRRMNTLTLQRHTQLLEILELPQLMDTCVRNGYYDEALELALHVKRLEKKHSGIPVIANIVNEVKMSTTLMLNQLIQQLRTNVQLPACLRVIGYLRRMDVFSEVELRIKFLQARDSWFQGILETVPKEDAYIHITKTIEASRVNLFDIITQYRAIFSDEDPLLSTSSKEEPLNEGALFHTWIVQKVSQFLAILEADLDCGVGGRLDSILGQCMYFGLSFSRVGADFRGLLTPIFQNSALRGFKVALIQANKRFEDGMRSYNLMSVASSGMAGLPYNPYSQSGQLYPPTILLDFHPLAAYCNDILTALNELRLCAPVALVTEVSNALHGSFINVNRIILAFHRAEETTFDMKEKERFDEFCSAYAHNLVPYINKCLQALYPQAQLAHILGVTVSELQNMGGLGQVNVQSALQTIGHLIPEVEPEPITSLVAEFEEPKVKIQDSFSLAGKLTSGQLDVILDSNLESNTDDDQPKTNIENVSEIGASQTAPELDLSPSKIEHVTELNTIQEVMETNAQSIPEIEQSPEEVNETDSSPNSKLTHTNAQDTPGTDQSPDEGKDNDLSPDSNLTDIKAQDTPGIDQSLEEGTEVKSLAAVRFSLSDTEGEVDLEGEILDTNIEVPDTEDNLDIESDLSALAADVFGTKTDEKMD